MKNFRFFFVLLLLSGFLVSSQVIAQPLQPNLVSVDNEILFDGNPGNVTLSITILNTGTENYPGGPLGIYFSSDTVLDDTEDSLVFIFDVPLIAYGDTVTIIDTIDFCDPSIAEGFPDYVLNALPFYLVYKLDYKDQVTEVAEDDNTGKFAGSLIMECLSGIENIRVHTIAVIPNPSNGLINLTFPVNLSNDATLSIQNMQSQLIVFSSTLDHAMQKNIDVSFLPAGTYLLQVYDDDQLFQSRLIIVK